MRPTVLYIEDDPSSAHLLELLFEQRPGVRLIIAPAGRQGLELARRERPSLILLDYHLQDMDGRDVLRALRAEPGLDATPVILLTAEQYPRLPEHLRALGAQAYLMKPLDLHELLTLVDANLAGRSG
jgi:DNA-binding response OmpR family regulator